MPFVDVLFVGLLSEHFDDVVTKKILSKYEENLIKIWNTLDCGTEGSAECHHQNEGRQRIKSEREKRKT